MLGRSEDLKPGDGLTCIGHSTAGAWLSPKELRPFAKRDGKNAFLFEFSCPGGHSGGAVFDKDWRLVGMMISNEATYCRALAIDPILKEVQRWKVDVSLKAAAPKDGGPKKSGEITVAVVDFDNRSAKNLPNLGSLAQDITTSFIHTLPGVVLVSRDRLEKLRHELKLPESEQTGTGLSQVGKLLKADAVVTGSILRYDVERRVFEGHGTSALMDVFRMDISLQIIDVATGRVQFAQTFPIERTKQYPKKTSAPSQPIDRTSEPVDGPRQRRAEGPAKRPDPDCQRVGNGEPAH